MLSVKKESNFEEWKLCLNKCINPNIFSTWEWGEFKKTGWIVDRLLFYKGTTFVGMCQILCKKMGPFTLGWCSSGINVVDYDYLKDIVVAIETQYDLKKTIIRFNFFDEGIGNHQFHFDSIDQFKKSMIDINSGYTIRFDLRNYSNLPKGYSSNNRYYLNKAVKNELEFFIKDFDAKEFTRLHNEMADLKDLTHLKITEELMNSMYSRFQNEIKIAGVKTKEGEIIAICAFVELAKISYYFLAGANDQGRKLSASFLMVNKLIDYFKSKNIEEFDFGGITPFKRNADGVNRFKIGFNGRIVRYVGERDFTKNKLLYWGFNVLLKFKKIN